MRAGVENIYLVAAAEQALRSGLERRARADLEFEGVGEARDDVERKSDVQGVLDLRTRDAERQQRPHVVRGDGLVLARHLAQERERGAQRLGDRRGGRNPQAPPALFLLRGPSTRPRRGPAFKSRRR